MAIIQNRTYLEASIIKKLLMTTSNPMILLVLQDIVHHALVHVMVTAVVVVVVARAMVVVTATATLVVLVLVYLLMIKTSMETNGAPVV